jgi:hypothetical protein
MLGDLHTKLKRYESRAADCSKAAHEAMDESGKAFYGELARYYQGLAADFRTVIAKSAVGQKEAAN